MNNSSMATNIKPNEKSNEKKNDHKQKKNRKSTFGYSKVWYVFLIPSFLGILLFMVYPIIESFRLSFYQSNGTIETFIGLKNFKYILTSRTFWNTVWNTFYIGFFQILITIP